MNLILVGTIFTRMGQFSNFAKLSTRNDVIVRTKEHGVHMTGTGTVYDMLCVCLMLTSN